MTVVTKKTVSWLNSDPAGEPGNSPDVALPLFAERPGEGFPRFRVHIFI